MKQLLAWVTVVGLVFPSAGVAAQPVTAADYARAARFLLRVRSVASES